MSLEIETGVKSKLNQSFSALNQRHCREEPVLEFEDACIKEEEEEEQEVSTKFLQTQKKQLFDMEDDLERNCNILPVFGFNSAKYDIILIRSYLLPLLVNGRKIEPTVIKKAIPFVFSKFGDYQSLDKNVLGGAKSLDFSLKAYKTSDTKVVLPFKRVIDPENLNNTQLPPY